MHTVYLMNCNTHPYVHVHVYLIRLDGCLAMNNIVNLSGKAGGRERRGERKRMREGGGGEGVGGRRE